MDRITVHFTGKRYLVCSSTQLGKTVILATADEGVFEDPMLLCTSASECRELAKALDEMADRMAERGE